MKLTVEPTKILRSHKASLGIPRISQATPLLENNQI